MTSSVQRLARLIRNIFRRQQMERDLDDELTEYVHELIERHIRAGLAPDAARRQALIEVGGMDPLKERVRQEHAGFALDLWMRDVTYALRSFGRSRGFVAVVILTLGLGIGASTALFSLVDAAVFRKLPVKNPDELVMFEWRHIGAEAGEAPGKGPAGRFYTSYAGSLDGDSRDMRGTSFSLFSFQRLRLEDKSLSDIFGFYPFSGANVSIDAKPDIVSGQLVSGNYYQSLGVQAAIGRTISESDDRPGADPVAVVTHRYWKQQLAADPAILGKAVVINGVAATIIGVTPEDFAGTFGFGLSAAVTLPLSVIGQFQGAITRADEPGRWWLRLMGRTKQGIGIDQVRASLERVLQQSAIDGWNSTPHEKPLPSPTGILRLSVFPGNRGFFNHEYEATGVKATVTILAPMFAILLLIVCVNISNVLLARAAAREREIAIRTAIGASRSRIIRQLLTESTLLATFGGVAGILMAYFLKDLLLSLLPDAGRLIVDLSMNLRVLGFAAFVSLTTGILFGLLHAFRGSRTDLESSLKAAGHRFTPVRSKAGKCLLAAQVAMSVVLVIGAGLLLQTVRSLQALDVGFNPDNLLLFQINPRSLRYENARINGLYEQIADRIALVPGVVAVSRFSHPLAGYFGEFGEIRIEGTNPGDLGWTDRPNMDMDGGFGGDSSMPAGHVRAQTVHWNLLDAVGVRILAGRGLQQSDDRAGPRVAVVNEAFARQFFSGKSPLGVHFNDGESRNVEVIGIVSDIGLARGSKLTPTPATVYLSDRQKPPQGRTNFLVRTALDPLQLVPAIREAVKEVEPALPLAQITTQVQQIESAFALQRVLMVAFSLFGMVGLLLVSIGLYGVMSFAVARRTNEIGIRLSLGARPLEVAWQVQLEILLVAFGGILLGILVWFAGKDLLASVLFSVGPTDTLTLFLAVLLMFAVAMIAGCLPARRAARVDPLIALRHD